MTLKTAHIALIMAIVFILAAGCCMAGDQFTDFGLYKYSPPGWNWAEIPSNTPYVTASDSSRGTEVHMRIPLASMPGFKKDSTRVGILSGGLGSQPMFWLDIGGSYSSPKDASLLDTIFVDGVPLREVKTQIDGDSLSLDVFFGSRPVMTSGWDIYVYIDSDNDPSTGYSGADYLIQNAKLGNGVQLEGLIIDWLEIRPGLVRVSEKTTVTALVSNMTDARKNGMTVTLKLPDDVICNDPFAVSSISLRAGEVKRFAWAVSTNRPGSFPLQLTVDSGKEKVTRLQWLTASEKRDAKREYQLANGAWLPYPARQTLQNANSNPVREIKSLPSRKLRSNLFGITAHLPRSTNLEDPFAAQNAVDGNPDTCWASRWWRTAVPFTPEWLEVDFGREVEASELRFLPAWNNGGLPDAFTIQVSTDRDEWISVADITRFKSQSAPEGSPLRYKNLSWQRFIFAKMPVRYIRMTATRLNQGATSFFCAPYEPFQFRIAEVALADNNQVVSGKGKARASTVHNAWYNSTEETKKTWPMELNSGVKINRISQWGDKTDWASIEQKKGVYRIDPEVDRAIDESVRNGVDILLTLDYGNNLYQTVKNAPDFGPTWHLSHPFLQCAPTTPEAVEAFAKWCEFMATHFKGRVKYFEIWNEENGWFFDDWAKTNSVEMTIKYGQALLAASKAIKEANPDAKVVFGGTAGMTLDYPRLALEQGAGPYIDAFAFHPYGHPTPEGVPSHYLSINKDVWEWLPRPAEIIDYETQIAALRNLLHKFNPGMQIWADEMNWMAPGEPPMTQNGDGSELSQGKHLARFFSINSWLGCGAVWWSLYNANNIQEWAVIRSSDQSPRAAYYSAGYVSTILDDVKAAPDVRVESIGKAPADLMIKPWRNGQGDVIIGVWRTSPADDRCKPQPIDLRVVGVKSGSTEIMDSLYGYRQAAKVKASDRSMDIPGLMVGDWPLFIRISSGK
ncbi:MAG: discoidin domain-containing protein [Armatimonadota bacterium]